METETIRLECALVEIPYFSVDDYREKTLQALRSGFEQRKEMDPFVELVVSVDPRTGAREEGRNFSLVLSPHRFGDDRDKDGFSSMIRAVAQMYDAVAYMFLSEAYMVERKKMDELEAPPSECVDRTEILQVIFEFEESGVEMHSAKIVREEGKVELAEWTSFKNEKGSGFGGRFTNVLPRREYPQ